MKSKPITIIIITLIIIFGICFLLIRPVVSSIWASYKGLEQAKIDIKKLEERRAALETLKNNPDLTRVNEIALKYIPDQQNSGELVVELAAIANTNGFQVDQVTMENQKSSTPKPDEVTTATPKNSANTPAASASPVKSQVTEVAFSLKATGTFANLENFLRGIETSSRLIGINALNLQVGQSQSGDAQILTVSMTGAAYYKAQISIEDNLKNIEVSSETISKFLNLTTFGSPINLPTESGFGRTNPFEGY